MKIDCLLKILPLIGIIASCTSIGETRNAVSIGQEDLKKIQSFEADLLDYRLEPDNKKIEALEKKLQAALETTSFNKSYKARIWGLLSEAAWDRKDRGRMESALREMDQLNHREAFRITALARLESDPVKAIEILKTALENEAVDEPGWVALELALFHLGQAQYRESAAAFDLAFTSVYSGYKTLYGAKRDLAYTLKEKQGNTVAQGQWALKKELTLEALVSLTLQNTPYLDIFTVDKKAPIEPLVTALTEKGYLKAPVQKLSQTQSRAFLAVFLHKIVSERKKRPEILTQPLPYKTTPIPDLDLNSPYLRAAIYLVQSEVLDLPDGVNFFPEQVPSGLETIQILERLKKVLK